MINMFFLSYLLCSARETILPLKTANAQTFINFIELNNTYVTGLDHRMIIDPTDKQSYLHNININYHKKRVLDTLISPNVATLQKIEIINKYDIFDDSIGPNIFAGGLMDDFNFEI